MASTLSNLAPTTELEAVNAMLRAAGEAPADSLDSPLPADVERAVLLLRDVSVEVQTQGWKFNTEFGYELAPLDTFDWVDTQGITTPLNIFSLDSAEFPSAKCLVTPTFAQADLDVVQRPPRKYNLPEGGNVFYDRALNRDGLDASKYPNLYLDVVWLFDFETLPQTARRFIAAAASVRYAVEVAAMDNVSLLASNESRALRALVIDQGDDDKFNLFDNSDTARIFGQRPRIAGFRADRRGTPGPA